MNDSDLIENVTKVNIFTTDQKHHIGIGTYVGEVPVTDELAETLESHGVPGREVTTPRFILESGESIHGTDCWYHPLE